MKTLSTMIAAALALVLQGGFAGAHAASTAGHCTAMTVTDYISSSANDIVFSASTAAWQNVTDGLLNFTTSSTGCVVITFSGVGNASSSDMDETLHVRTLIDGRLICVQGGTSDVFVQATNPNPLIAASITHVCKNVTAGAHAVQVQFSGSGDGLVQILGHMLTVTHN